MHELGRLARALHLQVDRKGDFWHVSGGVGVHVVNADATSCDCADFVIRGALCKHRVAIQLRLGNPDAIAALRELVPPPNRSRRTRGEDEAMVAEGPLPPLVPIQESGALNLWRRELRAGTRTMLEPDDFLRKAAVMEAVARDYVREGMIAAANELRREAATLVVRESEGAAA